MSSNSSSEQTSSSQDVMPRMRSSKGRRHKALLSEGEVRGRAGRDPERPDSSPEGHEVIGLCRVYHTVTDSTRVSRHALVQTRVGEESQIDERQSRSGRVLNYYVMYTGSLTCL